MNLWELCKEFVLKNVIASSSSVYGNNEKIPFSETDNVDNPFRLMLLPKMYRNSRSCLSSFIRNRYDIFEIFYRFWPRQRPDLAIHKFTKLFQKTKKFLSMAMVLPLEIILLLMIS
jgi:UDP-glucuronate 4-epimerase